MGQGYKFYKIALAAFFFVFFETLKISLFVCF